MHPDFLDWFTREILAHEAALTRYLARNWVRGSEMADLRHDIYVKVLEAAEATRPTLPRAFLFATARNLLADRARRNRVIPIDRFKEVDASNVLIDNRTSERSASGVQHLLRLAQAFEKLPGRCREVVWLRKIEDVPQKEIGRRLNIAEATVEAHLARGVKVLMQHCYGADAVSEAATRRKKVEHEHNSGQ